MKRIALPFLGLASIIGTAILGGCTTTEGGDTTSTIYMVVFLVLLFAIFYFLIIRPQRKRQQEQQHLMSDLKPGDRVVTIGGIYGQIESLTEDSVVLKIESGATIRVARRGIAFKQGEGTKSF
jgi:preprotein translocase subunit YajC